MTRADRLRSLSAAIETMAGKSTSSDLLRLVAGLLEQEPRQAVAQGAGELAEALEGATSAAETLMAWMPAIHMAEVAAVARLWREAAKVLREVSAKPN